MMRWLILCLAPTSVMADALVATRMIPAGELINAEAVTLVDAGILGALSSLEAALGLEAKITIYPGRPIKAEDLGPVTEVERNQIVTLIYMSGGLRIQTEGRALSSGASDDVIPVMNLSSRTRVSGRVQQDGSVLVYKSGS